MTVFGTKASRSVTLVRPLTSRFSPVNAEIAIGVSCRFSARNLRGDDDFLKRGISFRGQGSAGSKGQRTRHGGMDSSTDRANLHDDPLF